jgi:hypothetical protein
MFCDILSAGVWDKEAGRLKFLLYVFRLSLVFLSSYRYPLIILVSSLCFNNNIIVLTTTIKIQLLLLMHSFKT